MRWNTKGNAFVLVAIVLAAAAANSARAELLLYEPFDYAVGTGLGGGDPGGTPTEPLGYLNATSGTNWHAHQVGAGYNQAQDANIISGSLSYANLATSGQAMQHGSAAGGAENKYATAINLPTPITRPESGTLSVYMSFLVRQHSFVHNTVPEGTPTPGNRFGFAEFSSNVISPNGLALSADAQSNSTVAMPGTVWMRPDLTTAAQGTPQPGTHTQYGVGKSGGDGISASGAATWQNVATTPPENNEGSTRQGENKVPWADQTYFIVAKYTFNDPIWDARTDPFAPPGTRFSQEDSVSIYINPLSENLGHNDGEAAAKTNSLYSATGGVGTATADSNQIASFVLLGHRQGTGSANSNTTALYSFDELRIGTTWADVTPTAEASTPGDHNGDGEVDALDYVVWRMDPNNNGGDEGYEEWAENYGGPGGSGTGASGFAVPEPASGAMVVLLAAMCGCFGRRGLRNE